MKSLPTLTAALLALALPAFAGDQPGAHFIENWDLNADGAVTVQEIETRRGDVFLAFDSDENGLLDAEEYVYFDTARANDMQQADAGGQGGGGALQRAAEGMTLAFNDIDGSGTVSRDEFIARSGAWMALLDRDGDGQVTQADFGRM
jgi:hypothetical protein